MVYKPTELVKATRQPDISEYRGMTAEELVQTASDRFNVGMDRGQVEKNRELADGFVYLLAVMDRLGFPNPDRLTVQIQPDKFTKLHGGRAYYDTVGRTLAVGEGYHVTFVHEYFHHIYSHYPARELIQDFIKQVPESVMVRLAGLDEAGVRRGKPVVVKHKGNYYRKPTEVFARYGSQYVREQLKGTELGRAITEPLKARDMTPEEYRKVLSYFEKVKKPGRVRRKIHAVIVPDLTKAGIVGRSEMSEKRPEMYYAPRRPKRGEPKGPTGRKKYNKMGYRPSRDKKPKTNVQEDSRADERKSNAPPRQAQEREARGG